MVGFSGQRFSRMSSSAALDQTIADVRSDTVLILESLEGYASSVQTCDSAINYSWALRLL